MGDHTYTMGGRLIQTGKQCVSKVWETKVKFQQTEIEYFSNFKNSNFV